MNDWEERYQRGETPWERGYAAPALIDFLFREKIGGKILVPGCGLGHDVRALSQQGAEAIGLDWAPSAIQRAQSFSKVGRESYVQEDLFQLPNTWNGQFDWIFEHTCFCAIPVDKRPDYVQVACRILKKSGSFFGIFFLNPDAEKGPPFSVTREELDALFLLHFELQEEWVPSVNYPGREGRELVQIFKKR